LKHMSWARRSLALACTMIRDPADGLQQIGSERAVNALAFLLMFGAVTAFLTPVQLSLGFEDINGLHAGGQAEVLAKEVSRLYHLSNEWRPFLIEAGYVLILAISTGYVHLILKVMGGKGSMKNTFKMIAYGDVPGLLFGWIPYFATISALWAAVIQLLIGPLIVHKISWAKATAFFSVLIGVGIIDIALQGL